MITVLVSPEELAGPEHELAGDTYRHLFRSRRLAVGAELRLVDGAGKARWGKVAEIGPRRARVELAAAAPAHEPERRVRLLVAPPRSSRASWLVEKATELGVEEIGWLAAERSAREIGEGSLERLRRVAAAALEQAHGSRLPELSGPWPASDWTRLLARSSERIVLDPQAPHAPLAAASPAVDRVFAIGPEGGWTEAERELLRAAGCTPTGLGERILRVETAAVAVATISLLGKL